MSIAEKTKRQRSDIADEGWAAVEPFLPKTARAGSPRCVDMCEVMSVSRDLVRAGCACSMLPVHFPPWQAVYWRFRRLVGRLMFRTSHDVALMIDRALGAAPWSQRPRSSTVKSSRPAPGAGRGYDGSKTPVRRKRHIAVDTSGRLLLALLTVADISDRAGARAVLDGLHNEWSRISQLFADGAYDRCQSMDKQRCSFALDDVLNGDG